MDGSRPPRRALRGPRPADKEPGQRPSAFTYSQLRSANGRLGAALRPLPYRPLPASDESLLSYIQRLAHAHKLSSAGMLERLGLVAECEPAGHGLSGASLRLSDEHLGRVAHVARLELDQVRQLLLSRYDGIAFELDPANPVVSTRWQRRHNWLHLDDSHACPECLVEQAGAWRVQWKFAYVVACSSHERLLIDTCPACRPQTGGRHRRLGFWPAFARVTPSPGQCLNRSQDDASQPCLFDLRTAEGVRLSSSTRLLEAQRVVDLALAGDLGASWPQTAAPEFFADLRVACVLLLQLTRTQDLGPLPRPVLGTFADWVDDREHVRLTRARGQRIRKARREDFEAAIGPPPTSAALVAAVLPEALQIATADGQALRDGLRPLLDNARGIAAGERQSVLTGVRRELTPRLLAGWNEEWERLPRVWTRGRFAGPEARESVPLKSGLHPRHIPQLLWVEEYRAHFDPLLQIQGDGWSRGFSARRFCSIALAQLLLACSWPRAAASLDLKLAQTPNKWLERLIEGGKMEAFVTELEALAHRRGAASEKVDHGERRKRFSAWEGLGELTWSSLCQAAGYRAVREGGPGSWRTMASIWLWTELTGSSHTQAPLWDQRLTAQRYGRFVVERSAAYAEPLRYCAHEIGREADQGGDLDDARLAASVADRFPGPPQVLWVKAVTASTLGLEVGRLGRRGRHDKEGVWATKLALSVADALEYPTVVVARSFGYKDNQMLLKARAEVRDLMERDDEVKELVQRLGRDVSIPR